MNRERRATFDQSPAGLARRLSLRTGWENLILAGDSVDTGLPATIEGAIRSGECAAQLIALSVRGH
jgi:monoamine oxidase